MFSFLKILCGFIKDSFGIRTLTGTAALRIRKILFQADPFAFTDMVDHLVICNREQVALAGGMVYLFPVFPELFEGILYHIPRIFLMPEILKDEAVHIICVKPDTFVVFSFCHTASWVYTFGSSTP